MSRPLSSGYAYALPKRRVCGTSTIANNFALNTPSSFDVRKASNGSVTGLTVHGGC